jgi:hypothetical protein
VGPIWGHTGPALLAPTACGVCSSPESRGTYGGETHRVVRRRGSHFFYTIGSQTAVRLSASPAGRPLPTGRFLVLISIKRLS